MPATRRLILIIIVLFLLLLFLVVPGVSWSQTQTPSPPSSSSPWQESAREFCKKIMVLTGARQTVALTVRNLSSLSDSEVAAVRAALEAELRAAGLRLDAKTNGTPELRVTLSENLQGFLWVAEVLPNDAREVAMLFLPKSSPLAQRASPELFVLQSKLVWDQDQPILDFALLNPANSGSKLVVLSPAKLTLYAWDNKRWESAESVSLPSPPLPSRDPRGSIGFQNDGVMVIVAGSYCAGVIRPALTLKCYAPGNGQAVSLDDERQWFWTEVVPGRNSLRSRIPVVGLPTALEVEYSSFTGLSTGGGTFFIFVGLDGTAVLFRNLASKTPTARFLSWGSQLTHVHSDCGPGAHLLVTRPSDWTEPDAIQAFEISGDQAQAVSLPLPLPGPVQELLPGRAGRATGAVVHNLKTGRYEAYTLTLSCGR